MSAYQSYTPRRPSESTDSTMNDKLKDKVSRIQELFPAWSAEDLHSVLVETNGDVELTVVRISEGHAEQWGSVPRKKDKKITQSTPSSSRRDREKPSGDSRGGRGGRGGRGRGGSRGASRGVSTTNRSRDSGSAALNDLNGTNSATTITTNNVQSTEVKVDDTGTGVNDLSIAIPQTFDTGIAAVSVSKESIVASTVSAESTPAKIVDISSISIQNGSQNTLKAPQKTSKVPPGAKLSWAQIARAPEKPKQPVPSSPPQQSVFSVTAEHAASDKEEISSSVQLEEAWEEPMTAEASTWEDEPIIAAAEPQNTTQQEGWIMAESGLPRPTTQEAWDGTTEFTPPQTEPPSQKTEDPVATASSLSIGTNSVSTTTPTASIATSTAPTSKPSTPSVSSARIAPSHRTSARYLKTDQAVVIPAFAGHIGSSGEKLGMQFGSLSLGGEDNLDSTFKAEPEQTVPPAPESQPTHPQVQAQTLQSQPQPAVQTQIHDTLQQSITSSVATSHSHSPGQSVFQQPQANASGGAHVQTPAQQPAQIAHQSQQPGGSPFSSQLPPTLGHQQQPLSQTQPPLHGYTSQPHGHSQFDGPSLPQQTTQHAPGPQTGSYFRQTDSPYYHNPTPPQSAPPEHQGAYNAFSLGIAGGAHAHTQGLGGQGVSGHLGGFGTGGPGDYGYGDGQRGFYDYQSNSFSNRLTHDEPTKGGLPLSQTTQPTGSLGAGAGQPQASNPTQASSGQPPLGQQGQQGYPAPMPYYYPPYYPQNSYPTYPNPSYGQAYMPKYPPVYPHQGPVGPGSVPPPSGKGPGNNAPYNASASQNHLYHGQGAFEDPTASYQHHQGSTNLGAADYAKQAPHHQQQQQPLYGGQAGQGLQSFLGIQQSAGAGQGVGGPGGPQRSSTSPEAAYKPYGGAGGASDKSGIGSQANQQGRAGGIQQSQQQGSSSFYPGGRFGSAPGGPQQQGQQQGQGYPQTTDQSQFYPYQPRHQGGYWQ